MKIVVLGDSFTFGQGCSDTPPGFVGRPSAYCWASLIQKEFSVTVDNRSKPGYSNAAIVESLHQNLTPDIDLIIFCASLPTRIQIKQNEYVSESMSPFWKSNQNDPQIDNAVRLYYKHLYGDRIGYTNTITTVLAAYGAAKLIGADFLWSKPVHVESDSPTPSESISTRVFDYLNETEFLPATDFNYTKSELAPCGHSNDAGQLRYFNEIIVPLLKNKITGIQ
jgi:hypothetical protein